jgi:PAS domain S-box-containing protein
VELDREYLVAISRDITERKKAAASLEESERRFRVVYERAPVGIVLVESESGRFLRVNQKFCEIVGRSEEQLLELRFQDITHPDDLAKGKELFERFRRQDAESCEIEKRYMRPDGTIVWVNINVVMLTKWGENDRWQMAIVKDVTAQRMAEDALRESEERLRLAQEAAQIGTFERNFLTGENRWTPQMEKIYGLFPGAFRKPSSGSWNWFIPKTAARCRNSLTDR